MSWSLPSPRARRRAASSSESPAIIGALNRSNDVVTCRAMTVRRQKSGLEQAAILVRASMPQTEIDHVAHIDTYHPPYHHPHRGPQCCLGWEVSAAKRVSLVSQQGRPKSSRQRARPSLDRRGHNGSADSLMVTVTARSEPTSN